MNPKSLAFISFSLLLLSLGSAGISRAQEADEGALIMLMEGDFWLWREMPATFAQLTVTGHNAQPALSPDGSRVAYASVAAIGQAALAAPGETSDSLLPIDIGVLEVATGRTTALATQPVGASFGVEGTPDNFIARSAPSWSPDGSMLTWVEYSPTVGDYQLVTFDLRGGRARIIVPRLPDQAPPPTITHPRWGIGGIALHLLVQDAASGLIEDAFLVYDAEGALRAEVRQSAGEGGSVVDFFWVSDGVKDYLAVAYSAGSWALIDPVTGDRQPLTRIPELYSLAFPAASGKLSFTPQFDQQTGLSFAWTFVSSAGDRFWELPFAGNPAQVALSSTGQTVAYVGAEGVYIWREGQPAKIAGTEAAGGDPAAAVVWGVTGWRVSTGAVVALPTEAITPTPALPSDFECPGAPAPRLAVGGQGRVTPGTPNRLRAEPGGRYLRDIPGGATFEVLDGPVCQNGLVWWKVRYRGVEGWTVEGKDANYWLEPVR